MHHEDIVARQRERCRALRRESSETEKLLWRRLRHRQVRNAKFRRQHPVGPYILDFYCHEARLAVELDGGQHGDDAQAQYDQNRTLYLEEMGIQVLRFWNNEVLTRTDDVLATIWNAVERSCSNYENGTPHPTPLPKGEGEEKGRGCEELRLEGTRNA